MKKLAVIMLLCFTLFMVINAEMYESYDFYYSLDLPDNWYVADEEDTSQVIFSNSDDDAAIVIGVFAYEPGIENSALLQSVIDKMRLKGKAQTVKFKGYTGSGGNFTFTMNGTKLTADVFVFHTASCFFMLMGSSLAESYDYNQSDMEDIFNSFELDSEGLDAAYGATDSDTTTSTTTATTDKRSSYYSISMDWGDDASEFAFAEDDYRAAVEEGRQIIATGNLWEYYKIDPQNDPNYTQTFWARFFQDMYNKNYIRVSNMVEWFKKKAAEKRWSAYDLAANVMRCVQVIPYERPYNVISDETQVAAILDYFTPNEIAKYNKGDCDTKSMLIIMILRQLGYDAVLYFSEFYAHAMAGVNINASGTYKTLNGKKYYFIESTYPGWNIGDLPPDFGDPNKWTLVVIK